jgi:hypothetical protein
MGQGGRCRDPAESDQLMTLGKCWHPILELMLLISKRLLCVTHYAHICYLISPVVTAEMLLAQLPH